MLNNFWCSIIILASTKDSWKSLRYVTLYTRAKCSRQNFNPFSSKRTTRKNKFIKTVRLIFVCYSNFYYKSNLKDFQIPNMKQFCQHAILCKEKLLKRVNCNEIIFVFTFPKKLSPASSSIVTLPITNIIILRNLPALYWDSLFYRLKL